MRHLGNIHQGIELGLHSKLPLRHNVHTHRMPRHHPIDGSGRDQVFREEKMEWVFCERADFCEDPIMIAPEW